MATLTTESNPHHIRIVFGAVVRDLGFQPFDHALGGVKHLVSCGKVD